MSTKSYKTSNVKEASQKIDFINSNIYYLVRSPNSDNLVHDFFRIYDFYRKHKRLNKLSCLRIEEIYSVTIKNYTSHHIITSEIQKKIK